MSGIETLEEKLEALLPDLKKQVVDFMDLLLEERKISSRKTLFNMVRGFSKYKEKFTSLELQKKALE